MGEKRSGEFVGAFPAYGYMKSKEDNHKLVVDKKASEIVKKIFEWKVYEGLGNLSICHRLNDMGVLNPTGYKRKILNQNYNNSKIKEGFFWCPSTVRNILKNDIYIGNVTQGKRKVKSYKIHKVENVPKNEWITVENMHEPIIDKELFYKAQALNKVDTRVQNSGNLSIWAGILKCSDCGRAMHKKYSKNKNGKIYEYYICGTYRKKSNKLCTKHTIKLEDLENSVLAAIKQNIKEKVDIKKLSEKIDNSTKRIVTNNIDNMIKLKENEIDRIKKLKNGLYEDWKNEYITKEEYLEYKQKYEQDIKKIKNIIINLNHQESLQKEVINENNEWVENFWKNKNITKLDRDIVTELIECIEIHENKKITINFKFADFVEKDKNM